MTDGSGPPSPRDEHPPGTYDGMPPGAALAAAREARGLSIEDIAAATRIRATLVRSIEHDDYDRCGGDVYARGHIRAIAHVVDLDGDALVDDFDRRHGRVSPPLPVAPMSTVRESAHEVTRKATKPAPKWASAVIAVLAVVAVFLTISWFLGRDRPQQPTDPVDARGNPPIVIESPTPSLPPTPSASPPSARPKPTPPPPSGVSLRITVVRDETWLSVTSSTGTQLFMGTLRNGEFKDFRDPTALSVRYGNSFAVSLIFNGKPIDKPACDSQVCDQQYRVNGAMAG